MNLRLAKAPLTPRASAHLDMIRGLAAIAVLAGHVRTLFFVEYKDLSQGKSALLQLLYAATGLGHQAVMVFFVLSGFFVGGSVLNTLGKWSWKHYLVSRLSRLYLVLAPALALTAAIDWIAYRLPAGHFYYDLPIAYLNTTPLAGRNSRAAFAGNLMFLQGIRIRTFGSDSPLWSVAYEFWYYMLFPMLALILFSRVRVPRKAAYFAGILAVGVLLPYGIFLQFGIWLFGAAMHFGPPLNVSRPVRFALLCGAGALFGAVLMLARMQRIPDDWSNFAVGAAFALWCYLIVRMPGRGAVVSRQYQWCAGLISKCSYSVYAIHFPLVLLIRTSLGTQKWLPSAGNLARGAGIALAVFVAGLLFSRITEAHTDKLRAWAMRMLAPRRGNAAVAAI